jgi:hypothetical protein
MKPNECAEELTVHAQLGVVVGLLSTSVQSIGLTLQRKSHLLEEEKEDDARPTSADAGSWACKCSSWRT